jgi:hypothetical protein
MNDADRTGDDAPRPVKVRGHARALSNGRAIFVGYTEDRAHTVLKFTNDQGTETKVLLSAEATDALREMLTPNYAGLELVNRTLLFSLVAAVGAQSEDQIKAD